MEEELAKLGQQLWTEQRLREEEQRRREVAEGRVLEEQRRIEEEQHYRTEAEKLARSSRPLSLEKYLEACHSLNRAIQVVTDRSLTTQGETDDQSCRPNFHSTNYPLGRLRDESKIWEQVSIGQSFACQSSHHQLEYVKSLLNPISSEVGLRDFERDVVENSV